jgi:hypothetical protein
MIKLHTPLLLILFAFIQLSAKSHLDFNISQPVNKSQIIKSIKDLRSIESRVKPFLQWKLDRRKGISQKSSGIQLSEHDLLRLHFHWNKVSPQFKTLYKNATTPPDSFLSFKSAGGHFLIKYTCKGPDSVAILDTMGYDTTNWRIQINQKNGVPDYIDMVGWAMDSAWSMEINRFGFIAPLLPKNSQTPSLYEVVIEAQGDNFYGLTYVQEKADGVGYGSYISIRNEWSGSTWESMGYTKNPQNGVRVTAAHEFFHAIQYAMVWKVVDAVELDHFPLSWLEGTATSMEELAFPDINDYIQYSETYFSNTSMSFLDDESGNIYTNSLLTLFLFKFADSNPSIEFSKRIFFENFTRTNGIPFYQNIASVSEGFLKSWGRILNDFHSASYFTGARADTSKFIDDAKEFTSWNYQSSSQASNSVSKQISPISMAVYSTSYKSTGFDSLIITLINHSKNRITSPQISASLILHTPTKDSLIPLTLDPDGETIIALNNNGNFSDALVIVSNGHESLPCQYGVTFESCPVSHEAGELYTVTKISDDKQNRMLIDIYANQALRCDLSLTKDTNSQLKISAENQDMTFFSDPFAITIPETWIENSSINAQIQTLTYNKKDSGNVYRWSKDSLLWIPVNSRITIVNDTLKHHFSNISNNSYAIFNRSKSSKNDINVYPNPISLHQSGSGVRIESANSVKINSLQIRTIDGTLICSFPNQNTATILSGSSKGLRWSLRNRNLKKVSPGLYLILVNYQDNATDSQKKQLCKLLIRP